MRSAQVLVNAESHTTPLCIVQVATTTRQPQPLEGCNGRWLFSGQFKPGDLRLILPYLTNVTFKLIDKTFLQTSNLL